MRKLLDKILPEWEIFNPCNGVPIVKTRNFLRVWWIVRRNRNLDYARAGEGWI